MQFSEMGIYLQLSLCGGGIGFKLKRNIGKGGNRQTTFHHNFLMLYIFLMSKPLDEARRINIILHTNRFGFNIVVILIGKM